MSKDEMLKLINLTCAEFEKRLISTVKSEVELSIKEYRLSLIDRSKWCCEGMKMYATQIFGLPNPGKQSKIDGCVSMQWKGYPVIYCQFCGVKL